MRKLTDREFDVLCCAHDWFVIEGPSSVRIEVFAGDVFDQYDCWSKAEDAAWAAVHALLADGFLARVNPETGNPRTKSRWFQITDAGRQYLERPVTCKEEEEALL